MINLIKLIANAFFKAGFLAGMVFMFVLETIIILLIQYITKL